MTDKLDHLYNDIDPFAAEWIENLMISGEIPHGRLDTRSIEDLGPGDLEGLVQAHLFAGIAGWPLALRLAGWPSWRRAWTASLPCQPFSAAGKQLAQKDKRHLWPVFHRLVRVHRPPVIFGEQVPAAVNLGWLDGVFSDLEAEGYACGALVLPACGVGAPHIRGRIFWVAERMADGDGQRRGAQGLGGGLRQDAQQRGGDGRLEHAARDGRDQRGPVAGERGAVGGRGEGAGAAGGLADAGHAERRALGLDRQDGRDGAHYGRQEAHGHAGTCGEVRGRMAHAEGPAAGPSDALLQGQPDLGGGGRVGRLADGHGPRFQERRDAGKLPQARGGGQGAAPAGGGAAGGMAHADGPRPPAQPGDLGQVPGLQEAKRQPEHGATVPGRGGRDGGLADGQAGGRGQGRDGGAGRGAQAQLGGLRPGGGLALPQGLELARGGDARGGRGGFADGGPWHDSVLVPCSDGKRRRVGTRVFPLAHGVPRSVAALGPELGGLAQVAGLHGRNLRTAKAHRIGVLKGAGNAIVPWLAALFVRSYMGVLDDRAALAELM